MKRFITAVGVVVLAASVCVGADAIRQGHGNQKLGFGTVIAADVNDSIAIGSSAFKSEVTASGACQIGSGINSTAESLQYRDMPIIDGDGALGYSLYGTMAIKYSWFMDDWYESGGYVAGTQSVTNSAKFSEMAGYGDWLVTNVDGGGDAAEVITIMPDERNGILQMKPNNAAADSVQAQLTGESVKLRSGYNSAFNTRFGVSSTNAYGRVGLHLTGTTAAIGTPGTDYIGFYFTNSAAGTVAYFHSAKDSSATNITLGATTAAGYDRFAIAIVGTNCLVKMDGVLKATIPISSGVIPDDEALSPVMAVADSTTGQAYLKMDYIGTMQTRE